MEYVKERIGLNPLASPDLIDANHNPHELLNDLVNIAPLGTLTSPTPSASPPNFLLNIPGRSSSRHWFEDIWSYLFSPPNPEPDILELVITFPRPIRLAEIQIFFVDSLPSGLTVKVGDEDDENDWIEPKINDRIFGSLQGSPRGSWVWIQLQEPDFVQKILLRLSKPDTSSFIHLAKIRILEEPQSEPDEAFSIEDLQKYIAGSEVSALHTLNYCQSVLKDLPMLPVLLSRAIAICLHYEKNPILNEPLMDLVIGPVFQKLSEAEHDSGIFEWHLNAVVGLVYDLCCLPNERGLRNIASALYWLEAQFKGAGENEETVMFIRALSAGLWSVAEAGSGEDVATILTPELLQALLKWSVKLEEKVSNARAKTVVDYLICSICYCRPAPYVHLMHSLNLVKVNDGIDLKGGSLAIDDLEKWYKEGDLWTKLKPNEPWNIKLSCLETLGRASQAPTSAEILKESTLLESFNSAILEFCKAKTNGAIEGAGDMSNKVVRVAEMFTLYRTLSDVIRFRIWICTKLGSDFWFPVLNCLSCQTSDLKLSSYEGHDLQKMARAVIRVVETVYWNNQECQAMILKCMKEVLSRETKISLFIRDLIYRLISGKLYSVRITSERSFINRKALPGWNLGFHLHPSVDVKGRQSIFYDDAFTTVGHIQDMIFGSDNPTLRLGSCPDVKLPLDLPVYALVGVQEEQCGRMPFLNILELSLKENEKTPEEESSDEDDDEDGMFHNVSRFNTFLDSFADNGGLLLLFERLAPRYDSGISPDIISSFICFLRLPQYSEILLDWKFNQRTKDMIMALIREADDKYLESLEILPFEALDRLLQRGLSYTHEGRCLRRKMIQQNAFQYVLDYLEAIRMRQVNSDTDRKSSKNPSPAPALSVGFMDGENPEEGKGTEEEDEEETDEEEESYEEEEGGEKRKRVEKVVCLFNVINNFIGLGLWGRDDNLKFLEEVYALLKNSCVVAIVSGYLKNDSDSVISGRMSLYRVIFKLLTDIASVPTLWPLLTSQDGVLAILKSNPELDKQEPDMELVVKITKELEDTKSLAATYKAQAEEAKAKELKATQEKEDLLKMLHEAEAGKREAERALEKYTEEVHPQSTNQETCQLNAI